MLWFVGTGINGHLGLSLAAVDVLKKCDTIYVERFTSLLGKEELAGLDSIIGKKAVPVQRWFVEDGREILEAAKEKQVALVTYGDPLIATTHSELRTRAAAGSIKTGVLHAASGIASIMGECGLHMYKFGRTVTMMSEPKSAISVYNTVFDNLLLGCHTLVLTEYSHDEQKGAFFLDPCTAVRMLLDVERDQRHGVISEDTFVIVASRIGAEDSRIVSGKIKSLAGVGFGQGPHSLIIPGSLHFTEHDALEALTVSLDPPSDNAKSTRRISVQMVERYAPKAKEALQQMRNILRKEQGNNKGMFEVLDNAEFYIADAERFLSQGKHELAVLSMGYAEGLIDALRFQKGINPWNP
ncbi:diphthine synthase [Nitrososphaera sp.]|uniref:diphthine synthase n=1 Tax=Nitrososphaera sp. TaxID=1971748 RepID=UPI00317F1461